MLPWYIADNDVTTMCSAHAQPSPWLGVIGKVTVGDSLRRELGRLPFTYHALSLVCRLYTVGGTASDRPSN